MKTYKQWEVPNNTEVLLPDGTKATFLKMDGMYAKWSVPNPDTGDNDFATGNFNNLAKTEDGQWYVVPEIKFAPAVKTKEDEK